MILLRHILILKEYFSSNCRAQIDVTGHEKTHNKPGQMALPLTDMIFLRIKHLIFGVATLHNNHLHVSFMLNYVSPHTLHIICAAYQSPIPLSWQCPPCLRKTPSSAPAITEIYSNSRNGPSIVVVVARAVTAVQGGGGAKR